MHAFGRAFALPDLISLPSAVLFVPHLKDRYRQSGYRTRESTRSLCGACHLLATTCATMHDLIKEPP